MEAINESQAPFADPRRSAVRERPLWRIGGPRICGAGGPPAYPGVPGHEPDLEKARRDAAAVAAAMGELRKLVPRAASYVWETDYFEPNWQDSFWGDNYARLKRVKQKYDPDGLFFLHHGVGSEDWSADGFTWAAAMITSKLVSGSRKLPIWAARSA